MEPMVDVIFVSSVHLGKTCIQVYEIETGSCIKSYRGVCASSNSLCPVGLRDYIICGQKDKPLLQAWSLNQNESLQMRFPIPGRLNTMAVSQSEDKICALGIGEKIYIYHLNTGLQIGLINRHYQDITCLQFTACGNFLASAGSDGFVYLWSKLDLIESLHKVDKPQIQPHYVLGQHSDKVTSLCISETGMRGILVSCSLDHCAKVFDMVTGHLRNTIIGNCGFTVCKVNAIGSQIFLAGEKGKVWGVNLISYSHGKDIQLEGKGIECHKSSINHMALTTSGDSLITGGSDGEVKIWSVVMSGKKKMFEAPSFAFQKSLLVGRGAITNMAIFKHDREIFNLNYIKSSVYISPFNNQSTANILNAQFQIPIRRKEDHSDELVPEMTDMALELFSELKATGNTRENTAFNPGKMNEIEFVAYVAKLKKCNQELYQFCLKHILGEE